jgi:hypothetical protein
MRSTKALLSLAMVACLGESGAALAYNVIDHDQVQPIYTGASDLELYYQPRLAIADKGCDPYPAVSAVIDQLRCCKALPRKRESILLCRTSEDGFPLSRKRFTTAELINDGIAVFTCVNENVGKPQGWTLFL